MKRSIDAHRRRKAARANAIHRFEAEQSIVCCLTGLNVQEPFEFVEHGARPLQMTRDPPTNLHMKPPDGLKSKRTMQPCQIVHLTGRKTEVRCYSPNRRARKKPVQILYGL